MIWQPNRKILFFTIKGPLFDKFCYVSINFLPLSLLPSKLKINLCAQKGTILQDESQQKILSFASLIYYEINGLPCNLIGPQLCDVFLRRPFFLTIIFSPTNEKATLEQNNQAFLRNQSNYNKMKDR